MLVSINTLALLYCEQGWWKEAEKLEIQVIKKSKKVLEEKYQYTCYAPRSITWCDWPWRNNLGLRGSPDTDHSDHRVIAVIRLH